MKNPYLNAVLAAVYIVAISLLMHAISKPNTPDTIFEPMLALSLFTLSAGVMGYLFVARPIQMYIDGEKKGAVSFFLKTLGTFAVITLVFLLVKFI